MERLAPLAHLFTGSITDFPYIKNDYKGGKDEAPLADPRRAEDPKLTPTKVDLLQSHFASACNAHVTFPRKGGAFWTSDDWYRHDVEQLFQFCRKHDVPGLWLYLWTNWLQPREYALWSFNRDGSRIPRSRTTNQAESHFSRIKSVLRQVAGGLMSVDSFVIALATQILPHFLVKLHRRAQGHGDEHLRRLDTEWRRIRQLPAKEVPLGCSLEQWTCPCHTFQRRADRWCSHLVHLSPISTLNESVFGWSHTVPYFVAKPKCDPTAPHLIIHIGALGQAAVEEHELGTGADTDGVLALMAGAKVLIFIAAFDLANVIGVRLGVPEPPPMPEGWNVLANALARIRRAEAALQRERQQKKGNGRWIRAAAAVVLSVAVKLEELLSAPSGGAVGYYTESGSEAQRTRF